MRSMTRRLAANVDNRLEVCVDEGQTSADTEGDNLHHMRARPCSQEFLPPTEAPVASLKAMKVPNTTCGCAAASLSWRPIPQAPESTTCLVMRELCGVPCGSQGQHRPRPGAQRGCAKRARRPRGQRANTRSELRRRDALARSSSSPPFCSASLPKFFTSAADLCSRTAASLETCCSMDTAAQSVLRYHARAARRGLQGRFVASWATWQQKRRTPSLISSL